VKKIGRFHVLTDICLQTHFSHVELAELAIAGGADTIQFRQKDGATREMIRVAEQMQALCKRAGVTFIINDRVDVAIASHADGVHLGQDDFPIPLARKLLGEEAIIGGSAGNLEEARKCLGEGADYIGFGPVYPTTSKDAPVSGLTWRQVSWRRFLAYHRHRYNNTIFLGEKMRVHCSHPPSAVRMTRRRPDAFVVCWRRDNMTERVSDIGEFGLIRRIDELVNREGIRSERVTVGIGDDTAAFLPRPGYELLMTCDCIVENRHYLPEYIRPLDLGRRAMVVNSAYRGPWGKPSMPLSHSAEGRNWSRMSKRHTAVFLELNPFV
jgi:thiamine-phosphate diphosphorylase